MDALQGLSGFRTMCTGFAPFNRAQAQKMKDHGIRRVIVGLDDEPPKSKGPLPQWRPRAIWNRGTLESTLGMCKAMGFQVGVHYWGAPSLEWESRAHSFIRRLHGVVPLDFVWSDDEWHMEHLSVQGFDNLEAFRDWRTAQWHTPPYVDPGPDWPVWGGACYGYPTSRSKVLAVPWAERMIMVYGNRQHIPGNPIPVYQGSISRWKALGMEVTVGVGAWAQGRPELGWNPDDTWKETWKVSAPRPVAIWSLKHMTYPLWWFLAKENNQ